MASKWESSFPWGTWVINVTGSFALGVLTGLALHHGLDPHVVSVLGTGICGGYTTFSTFNVESVRLAEDGSLTGAVANITGSIAAGLLAGAAVCLPLGWWTTAAGRALSALVRTRGRDVARLMEAVAQLRRLFAFARVFIILYALAAMVAGAGFVWCNFAVDKGGRCFAGFG